MLSTTLKSGLWDKARQVWTLHLQRSHSKESTQDPEFTISSPNVILAIGSGGQNPIMPTYPNQAAYKGLVLHSVDYTNASEWKSKRGIVIGTANTGHDVAEDMVAAGMKSVTMVQRGRTCESLTLLSLG
jgi:cation diffusion facilitator CzcD-associated flavoprotein CzcO